MNGCGDLIPQNRPSSSVNDCASASDWTSATSKLGSPSNTMYCTLHVLGEKQLLILQWNQGCVRDSKPYESKTTQRRPPLVVDSARDTWREKNAARILYLNVGRGGTAAFVNRCTETAARATVVRQAETTALLKDDRSVDRSPLRVFCL